jgi:hypothetical protein
MTTTTHSATQTPGRRADHDRSIETMEHRNARRTALRTRHAKGLTQLMEQRRDLRGVHALADFVDDAVRWTV